MTAIARQRPYAALWAMRHLLWDLTQRDLRQQFVGSAGGFVWLLARPTLMTVAYFFVFDIVLAVRFDARAGTENFGVYLVSGLIPWLAWNEAIVGGASSLLGGGFLLKKAALPPELFPAKAVLTAGLTYFPIVLLITVASVVGRGIDPSAVLMLPLWFAVQLALSFAIAMTLSIMVAALRDVQQVVQLVTTVWVFFSSVFFPLDRVPESLRFLLWLNPGMPLVEGYHAIILKGQMPGLAVIGAALGWTAVVGFIGTRLFRRCRDQVVDWV